MTIEVRFDLKQRHYIVSNAGQQIAVLPLVYLEGRKAAHIQKIDIERAFTEVFDGQAQASKSDFQRRDAALGQLGLLSHI